jgi:hypothetical protein
VCSIEKEERKSRLKTLVSLKEKAVCMLEKKVAAR